MIPGLGFLYSGLARRKSALSVLWACMMAGSVVNVQWYFWGYSLTFSPTATNGFIGNLDHIGLRRTLGQPSPGSPLISALLYAFYQVCPPASVKILVLSISRCNSVVSPLLSLPVLWPREADYYHSWSGHSCGPHLFITHSLVGHGTPTDGAMPMV